jgi:N-acetyl-gamma-glutamyl-phosphate reductase
MIKVGIVGGTGYTGVELLRLLAAHPEVEIAAITSRGEAGTPVARMFPSLRGRVDLAFTDPAKSSLERCDCVFFATPNGVAMSQARAILDGGARIVDFSADFRLKDRATWEKWYKVAHASPELFEQAVYGLPEINREKVRGARLVANPGCYATAVQLALLPLIETDFVDHGHLIADGKSGVSGAGRKAELGIIFPEASDNFKAYAVHGHRHHPEILESLLSLEGASGRKLGLTFVPHLTPMVRGILATVYARITAETDFQALFERRFKGEPFVDVLPPGSEPETRWVRGSNHCRIAVHRPMGGDTLVVLAVEDNLVKGAAGQAVQNMNLMFGFPETTAIDQIALLP